MKNKKSKLSQLKSFQVNELNEVKGGLIKTEKVGEYYGDTYALFKRNIDTVITTDYLFGVTDN